MALLAFGINHKTAPIALRERVALVPEAIPEALRGLSGSLQGAEVAVLSTCNRTEFYAYGNLEAAEAARQWLSESCQIDANELASVWYVYQDEKALQHAIEVASGLDSLVLGEPQIFGQMKSAWSQAVAAGTAHQQLDHFFQHVFAATKQVRSETALGLNPVSVGFAAVTLAKRVFESLAHTRVLLVGAGEMNTLVAKHLREQGVHDMTVVNRTWSRGQALAESVGVKAAAWEQLAEVMGDADIVISCTGSPDAVVTAAMVKSALHSRRHQPMLLIDLAVPRDIEPNVAEFDDAFLYTVDDLQSVIDSNLRSRQEAAKEAQALIALRMQEFRQAQKIQQDAVQWIRAYRQQALSVADEVQAKALRKLAKGDAPADVLARFQHDLLQKLLHQPTVALRELAAQGQSEALQHVARALGLQTKE